MDDFKNPFDLEEQFAFYVKKVGLESLPKKSIQYIETKRAWFAGVGQTLLLSRDHIGTIEKEEEAVLRLENLLGQTQDFWEAQE